MNTAKGQEGFLPGTQNQNFHSYLNGGNNQDDWRNDTTGVKYFHIVGAGLVPDTINQVVAASLWKCLQNYSICDLSTWDYPKFTQGDTTVPLLSLTRMGATLNYNAPNATVYECQAFGANNQNVDHTGILSNPVAQNLLTGYLTQANGGATVNPPPSLQCGQGQTMLAPDAAENKFHRVVLHGAKEISVSDSTSNQFPDTVTHYDAGERGSVLTLGTGRTYTIAFRATNEPLFIEYTYRNANEVRRALRYRDVKLPPNAQAVFNFSDVGINDLQYDSDGDGIYDSAMLPTTSLKGKDARDVRPPKLEFSSRVLGNMKIVTLAATDKATGVANVVYSLDGVNFQIYTQPFAVDASIATIYAFADDKAGNRSRPHKFRVR